MLIYGIGRGSYVLDVPIIAPSKARMLAISLSDVLCMLSPLEPLKEKQIRLAHPRRSSLALAALDGKAFHVAGLSRMIKREHL